MSAEHEKRPNPCLEKSVASPVLISRILNQRSIAARSIGTTVARIVASHDLPSRRYRELVTDGQIIYRQMDREGVVEKQSGTSTCC